ncbi:unnamed protein product [Laminaria digitata]
MVRHPIDRLISAFYYCPHDHDIQNRPSKWCGDSVGEKEPIRDRLMEYARFWGNKAFRSMMGSVFCNPTFELCDPEHAEVLSTYTAVGIFEEWELSMRLFDAKVKTPVQNWDVNLAANRGNQSAAREDLRDWAHTSVKLHTMLAADMLLYDYALAVFREQTMDALLL